MNMPSIERQRRRRAGRPKSTKQARVTPPVAYQGTRRIFGGAKLLVVAAVVETVRVPVAEEAPVMSTGDVVPKLKVGESTAPSGLDARAAVRVTFPVKPPLGMTLIVVVLPVVVPGELMVMAPPLVIVKLGATYALTVTVTVVWLVIAPDMPVTVTS
jgi:hypothetical protein